MESPTNVSEKYRSPENDFEFNEKARENLKKGDIVLRVFNGEKIGSTRELLKASDKVSKVYATSSVKDILGILYYNDDWASINMNNPYDYYQRVAAIKIVKWHIPEKDITYNSATDSEEIVVDEGEVVASLSLSEFYKRFDAFI